MKLRTKTLLIICVASLVLSAVLSVTSDFIVSSSYSDIERQTVTKNVERVINQLDQEDNNLMTVGYDWSDWDDTYEFINDSNENYIDMNLQYDIFSNIRTNFMLFYNSSDELVYSIAFDFIKAKRINLSEGLFSYVEEHSGSLLNHQDLAFNKSGIVLYAEKETPVLISATPILHSNNDGPSRGTLIVGRFLDDERIHDIENITQFTVKIHSLSNNLPIAAQKPSSIVQGMPVYIQPMNMTYIAGYVTIDDIVGHPIFVLEVGSNRYVYNQGLGLIQNLIISLFIIMIVFIILIIIIMDRFVTSRLTALTKSVNDVRSYKDLQKRVQVKGNDEIALLERKIDSMLASLHKAWTMKDVTEASLKKKIDELERFKTVTVDREIKMIELKKQLAELKAHTAGGKLEK